MHRIMAFLILFFLSSFVSVAQFNEQAIVKIFVTSTPNNPDRPWTTDAPVESSGTGFIIEGNRILTNAHVVEFQTYIAVKRAGEARRYEARAVYVSHQADIALLRVNDESFFEGTEPLEIGQLPGLRDQITIVGYPRGGDEVSYSSGIVSRIETNAYAYSMEELLTIQVDAAINPGNSGGPAILDGRVVGIAMMGIPDAQNVGYLITPEVIRHFLRDIEDGTLDGHPRLQIRTADLENPMLRKAYHLDENGEVGMLVHATASDAGIRPGDVILAMDDIPILSNKKIRIDAGLLVFYLHYISMRQVGEQVRVRLLRDGEEVEVVWVAQKEKTLIPYKRHEAGYPYYLFGGYLFTPLYYDFIDTFGDAWPDPKLFSFTDRSALVTPERRAVVFLHSILQHSTTQVAPGRWCVVNRVNGTRVVDFPHFASLMDMANGGLEIEFDDGLILRLNVEECRQAESTIMETYGIPKKKIL